MILQQVSSYYKKQNIDTDKLMEELRDGKDTFFSTEKCIETLIDDYKKYGRIIVAYDYDDTVEPSTPEYSCTNVVKLLQLCSKFNDFEMICFTARATVKDVEDALTNLDSLGIRHDAVNEDCYRIKKEVDHQCESKIMFSIFLDNRAGLESAYKILLGFVEWYLKQPLISE